MYNGAARLCIVVAVSEKEETVSKLLKMLSSNSSDSQLVCDCLYAQSLMLITDQNRSQFYSNSGASAVGAICKSFPGQLLLILPALVDLYIHLHQGLVTLGSHRKDPLICTDP